jgi:predicted dehydrogenase
MTTLKWGLIGTGDIARRRVAPALVDLPSCELLAVSRGRPELAEPFAREFGVPRWYANWQDLLNDKEIDAVYIATPVHLHAAQTIAAANSGKHVLCEKPMAMNPHECEEMIAACRANNVKLGVAYYRHFYPVMDRIKNLIAAGEIGRVTFAQINAFEWFDPPPDHPRHWLIDKAQAGGGPMFDFGCHRIEVLTDLFGPCRRLKSIVANVVFDREVEDTAATLFQFESGVCATLTVTHAASEPQDTLDIFGTHGSLHIPVLNKGEIRTIRGSEAHTEFHPPAPNIHQPLIEDFVQAVLTGREPKVDGEIGLAVAQIEEEIYESGRAR